MINAISIYLHNVIIVKKIPTCTLLLKVDEQYPTKETKGLEDFENPLDPVNHIHYLTKRVLFSHSGFDRAQIQDYLNLYSFILNPPFDKSEKVDLLLNLAFQNPKLLRFRDQFTVNT